MKSFRLGVFVTLLSTACGDAGPANENDEPLGEAEQAAAAQVTNGQREDRWKMTSGDGNLTTSAARWRPGSSATS
jgi:hypothetical protein